MSDLAVGTKVRVRRGAQFSRLLQPGEIGVVTSIILLAHPITAGRDDTTLYEVTFPRRVTAWGPTRNYADELEVVPYA